MKLVTIEEALDVVGDADTIGIGGVLERRRPLAACAALARSGRAGLHVSSFLAGPECDVLVSAGCLRELTAGYLDPATTTATASAIDAGTVRWNMVSELLYLGGLRAVAAGLPFWPTLGAVGSDLVAERDLRSVTCPYSGRPVLAVAATPLDLAMVHAPAATAAGAVLFHDEAEFLFDADVMVARAARHVIVTADRLATDEEVAGGRRTMLAPFEVDAVVVLA